MNRKINVAIIGVGCCAKSLVEGVSFYKDCKEANINGVSHSNIGGYYVGDINFVSAWDIDYRKVGKPLHIAIKEKPNITWTIKEDASDVCGNTIVKQAPRLDGIGPVMLNHYDKDYSHVPLDDVYAQSKEQIVKELVDKNVDIMVNYLPVGSQIATEFWMECALEAKVNVVNCIPVFIASNLEWEQRFIDAGLTIIGDDMRSQAGASIISTILQEMFFKRGHKVTMHYQDNVGGNTDFLNMQDPDRLKSKKISKENVIKKQNELNGHEVLPNSIHAGPAQYFPVLGDNKRAHWLIKAEGFGGAPVEFTADLSVQDSPNSAGVVIDAIRMCKVASEMGIVGAIHGGSAFTQKTPPIDMSPAMAIKECDALARRELTDITSLQLKSNNPNAYEIMEKVKKLVRD